MLRSCAAVRKRPQLSDLRESGAIEQDADIVAFIHRPEYYGINQDENGMPTAGMAEIIIAKHRNGAVTDVNLRFLKDQARFADVDETLMPEAGSRPAPGQYEDVSSGSNSGLGGFGGVPRGVPYARCVGGAREPERGGAVLAEPAPVSASGFAAFAAGKSFWSCGSGSSDRGWRKIA